MVSTTARLADWHRRRAEAFLARNQPPAPVAAGSPRMLPRPLELTSMWGIGDNIMHRAVLRELMKTPGDLYLSTHNPAIFHDLIEDGLKLSEIRPGARIREGGSPYGTTPKPRGIARRALNYDRLNGRATDILVAGSPLAAQFASIGMTMPAEPDFSFRVPTAWRARARALIDGWDLGGRPLLIYRPIILNTTWLRPTRAPDVAAYSALFEAIKEKFFTVSIAAVYPDHEWIVGEMPRVDKYFNHGELDFEIMAGLFAEADLVFGNAGFVPILAHATRTPVVIVYGGHESYLTTEACAAHLSPTLGIDPDKPCDCHTEHHQCDKTITIEPAKARLLDFVDRVVCGSPTRPAPRVLIGAATYIKDAARKKLLDQWLTMTIRRNPDCDILLVDTPPSPGSALHLDPRHGAFVPYAPGLVAPRMLHRFADNVGHLTVHREGPKDGWGRAVCFLLQAAIDGGYDYVVHIEGDSLFRLPVMPIVRQMRRRNWKAASTLSVPGRADMTEVETGLMFFETRFMRESKFIARYNWPSLRTATPSPENIIHRLLGEHLHVMPWRAERGHGQLTPENVVNYDWITWATPQQFDNFAAGRLPQGNGRG